MKCSIYKSGETRPSATIPTVERGALTMLVRHVPAQTCDNCGDKNIDEATTQKVLAQAETATRQGATVEVREFATACNEWPDGAHIAFQACRISSESERDAFPS